MAGGNQRPHALAFAVEEVVVRESQILNLNHCDMRELFFVRKAIVRFVLIAKRSGDDFWLFAKDERVCGLIVKQQTAGFNAL